MRRLISRRLSQPGHVAGTAHAAIEAQHAYADMHRPDLAGLEGNLHCN